MSAFASMVRRWAVASAGLALVCSSGVVGAAGSAQKEIQTAAQHAQFAANGKSVSEAHLHLHHVINCLVEGRGEGFDAQAGNPCQGQGNGALNDFTSPAEGKALLEQALALAKVGVQVEGAGPTRTTAQAVYQLLSEASTVTVAPASARQH